MKREVGYVALGLILAVAVTVAQFQLAIYTSEPAAYQILRETSAKAEIGFVAKTTFGPILSVIVLVLGLACACLVYSVTRKRSC